MKKEQICKLLRLFGELRPQHLCSILFQPDKVSEGLLSNSTARKVCIFVDQNTHSIWTLIKYTKSFC